ncbi:hypothetical protein RUND412_007708 [Rhizina undulata]
MAPTDWDESFIPYWSPAPMPPGAPESYPQTKPFDTQLDVIEKCRKDLEENCRHWPTVKIILAREGPPCPSLLGKGLDLTKMGKGGSSVREEDNKSSDGDSCSSQEEKTSSSESQNSTA